MLKKKQRKQQDEPNHAHKLLPPQLAPAWRSFLARAHKGLLPRCPAGRGDAPGMLQGWNGDAEGPLPPESVPPQQLPAPAQASGSRRAERRCRPPGRSRARAWGEGRARGSTCGQRRGRGRKVMRAVRCAQRAEVC